MSENHPLMFSKTQNLGDCAEFEKLRLKRIKYHRQKMLKYVEILKSQNKEEERLLDELLNNKSE